MNEKMKKLLSEADIDAEEQVDWDKAMRMIVRLLLEVDALEKKLEEERRTFAVRYATAEETLTRLSAEIYGSVRRDLNA